MKSSIVATILILSVYSCTDIFRSDEHSIVGKLSVIDSNDEEGGRYKLVFYEREGFNSNVVNDYVVSIAGDDSCLIVKCLDRESCDETYYKIKHRSGDVIINVTEIDENSSNKLSTELPEKYIFFADRARCP